MYVCIYACMYVCMSVYACMYVWMDEWMDACTVAILAQGITLCWSLTKALSDFKALFYSNDEDGEGSGSRC